MPVCIGKHIKFQLQAQCSEPKEVVFYNGTVVLYIYIYKYF